MSSRFFCVLCSVYPIFSSFGFWYFGHFWRQSYENKKILRNLCLHFARQDGQDGKNPEHMVKKITQLKWPKYQKPKDENMAWTEHKLWFLYKFEATIRQKGRWWLQVICSDPQKAIIGNVNIFAQMNSLHIVLSSLSPWSIQNWEFLIL